MIKVIMKRTYEPVGRLQHISNDLKTLQDMVGGYIETVTLRVKGPKAQGKEKTIVVISDEEGRLKGKDPNCEVMGVTFVGPIIVAGVSGDEFADVPLSLEEWTEIMRTPGEIIVRI